MKLFLPASRCAVVSTAIAAMSLLTPTVTSAAPAAEIKTFRTAGKHTFTVPESVTELGVVTVGAGGGGGGGGGNNGGAFTGGGGGGGGAGAQVECTLPVEPGTDLTLTVGRAGSGGAAGGQSQNGSPGKDGSQTSVQSGARHLVVGAPGRGGKGGQGSTPMITSGYGGARGAGGPDEESGCGYRPDLKIIPGEDGTQGDDGYRNSPGTGGGPGLVLGQRPQSCGATGFGGGGGDGAGTNGGSGHTNRQLPASNGKAGTNGCVLLTYTPPTSTS